MLLQTRCVQTKGILLSHTLNMFHHIILCN